MMRSLRAALLSLAVGSACAAPSPSVTDGSQSPSATTAADGAPGDAAPNQQANQMRIRIGSAVSIAKLEDNETASALKAMLPLALDMSDLHANEKYAELPRSLPANASSPGTIHAGDVMLYGPSTIVLFYKTFETSYSYTRLGKVDDASGIAAALGSGNVAVRLEL